MQGVCREDRRKKRPVNGPGVNSIGFQRRNVKLESTIVVRNRRTTVQYFETV